MATTTYATSVDSRARLADLGLEDRHLVVPVQRGLLAWAACTSNHPLLYPGYAAWAETVRALREELVPIGWQPLDDHGLPLVVNPHGTLAIAVSTADAATGRRDEIPSTRSGKGPKTEQLVTVNQWQANLFPTDEYLSASSKASNDRTTWILLFCRDDAARELRCELSRPIHFDGDERAVNGWLERIILTATPFDNTDVPIHHHDAPSAPDINIEITKRA
jgi:hypothetical protein